MMVTYNTKTKSQPAVVGFLCYTVMFKLTFTTFF
jgi:hypothetical protein